MKIPKIYLFMGPKRLKSPGASCIIFLRRETAILFGRYGYDFLEKS